MKFSQEINQYISGEKFSSALQIPFSPGKFEDISRPNKVVQITQNKRVIHIGCADHLPLIEEKIKKQRWLHKLLVENTKECIGIDNNEEAVDYISNKLGIKGVYCMDILSEEIDLGEEMWDYVVLGELIEHIDNPMDFLQKIRNKFQGKAKKIIITTPNILNIFYGKYMKKNIEHNNSDHKYWFSPYTLTKIATLSGFRNCELSYAESWVPFFRAVIRHFKRKLKIKSHYKANYFFTLVLTADFE
jgi:2-polyprenyl-3-methyl-5-hydroxy-6-metoxy-1,4-benzoquinol methylase